VTGSGAPTAEMEAPVESVEELVDFLRSGEKPPERWRVGTEHEKIGLLEGELTPIPYEGPRGIGVLLERIAVAGGWEPVAEAGRIIALIGGGASITLEPGGQLELSGAPLRTIHETCDEFHTHLALMKEVCEEPGMVWLGLGMHPIHAVRELPVMPKERYRIMRSYLPGRGSLALDMMFATATVQANFDYASEADMVEKMRVAMAVSPLVSAIFANSSLSEGKPNGFVSKRLHTWEDTDPDRTGLLPFVFDEGFGYRRYVDWAIDVPMFFIVRGDRYEPCGGISFRRFMEQGFAESRATLADFDRHLTTLFPDVRLKRFIEVRGADAVPPGLTCSLPALWKGLLYDATARAAA
jgi:glutamate--cysteine ligase